MKCIAQHKQQSSMELIDDGDKQDLPAHSRTRQHSIPLNGADRKSAAAAEAALHSRRAAGYMITGKAVQWSMQKIYFL